jgi:uncharacterized MAPEG superfamily protein
MMGSEMSLLVWSVALTFAQMLIAVSAATLEVGLPKLAGNREDMPDLKGFAGRAQRAHRNMLESLVLFAVLELVVQFGGRSNALTQVGANLFFWGRLAYAIIYLAGIPWLRTAAWGVSVVGLVIIFLQVLLVAP